MRRSVRAGFATVAVGVVVLSGCGGGDDTSGSTGGDGTPADVVAHGDDALQFDQKQYTAAAGDVEIELVNDGGGAPHTLLIEKVSSFKKLEVKQEKGATDRGTAKLEPGTYTIYCDVAGHRGAGMEAKLVIN